MVQRAWAFVSAGLGLVVIVLDYVDGAVMGSWLDDHGVLDAPAATGGFVIAAVGVVLLLGGMAVGLTGGRRRR